MRRLHHLTWLSALLPLACLPPAKTACRTRDDCSQGRVCVEGTCRPPGQDAAGPDAGPDLIEDRPAEDAPQIGAGGNGSSQDAEQGVDDLSDASALDTPPRAMDAGRADGKSPEIADSGPLTSCTVPMACPGGLSCCESIPLPAGTFPMGRSAAAEDACPTGVKCDAMEQPEHPVTVSSFALDAFETTVGRFRVFMQYLQSHPGWQPSYGAGAHPRIPNSGWNEGWTATLPSAAVLKTHLKCYAAHQTWTDSPGANENKPINCINWFEAFAFCAWDGGRLPTEAEWEYAAAGGAANRLYPWGDDPADCQHANVVVGAGCAGGALAPLAVGSAPKGAGRWGHRDLAGNLAEWILDRCDVYSGEPRRDWANLDSGTYRCIRGGSFGSYAENYRSATRGLDGNGFGYNGMGVRCARDIRPSP